VLKWARKKRLRTKPRSHFSFPSANVGTSICHQSTLLAEGILDTRGEARVGIGTAWNGAAV
jgi:hypothetical protein